MSDLDALLAGIVANPHESLRWLILADWLDDHDHPERAELLRLHRMLIDTCCEPDAHPERAEWQARAVALLDAGVEPCVPRRTLPLPGGVGLPMVFVPPGSFLMGGTECGDEQPVHRVMLTRGFWVGVSPVTQAQWRAVMGTDPSHFKGDELPVETVSWGDAQAFCGKVSDLTGVAVRLLSEAEWEYACRSGTTTHFHWGDVPDAERMNYNPSEVWNGSVTGEYRAQTTAVGTFGPNPWALCDCHGNVWEWCGGYWSGAYPDGEAVDPVGPDTGSYPVFRGGGWTRSAGFCRAAYRGGGSPDIRGGVLGFRLAAGPSGPAG